MNCDGTFCVKFFKQRDGKIMMENDETTHYCEIKTNNLPPNTKMSDQVSVNPILTNETVNELPCRYRGSILTGKQDGVESHQRSSLHSHHNGGLQSAS